MKVYKINQYEAYRADEQGVRYSINAPGNDTEYYKSEVETFDIELPDGFTVFKNILGDKILRYGENEVLIGEDEKGVYLEICNIKSEKVYVDIKK